MSRRYLRFSLVCLASICAGCASAPVRYYTLIPPPNKTLPASQATLAIDVRVVHTPPQLKRFELMVRTGPTEMALLENERWLSPLNDEIKEALRLELQSRAARLAGMRPTLNYLTLEVEVRRFEAELGRYALLEASWSATFSTAGQPLTGVRAATCTFQAEEQVHAGYAGIVEGYQLEIAALADAIVTALTSAGSDLQAPCQQSIQRSAGGSGAKDH